LYIIMNKNPKDQERSIIRSNIYSIQRDIYYPSLIEGSVAGKIGMLRLFHPFNFLSVSYLYIEYLYIEQNTFPLCPLCYLLCEEQ